MLSVAASVTVRTPASVPGAPVVAVAAGNGTLRVSWRAPEDTSGLSISTYTVYWSANDASTSIELSGDAEEHTLEGLMNGVGYRIEVSATSEVGEGIRSAALVSTPRTVPEQVANVSATGLERGLEVMWDVPGNGGAVITAFNVYWGEASVDESSRRVSYSGTSTTGSYTIGNLGGNTLYQIAVAAVNIAGEGGLSEVSTARTPASAPGAPVVAVAAGNGTLRVSWSAPEDTSGLSISTYTVYWSANDASTSIELSGDAEEHTLEGLMNGVGYRIEVSATSEVGEGIRSAALVSTPRTVPEQVANVSATGLERGLEVMWDVPGNGGAVITAFNVYWGEASVDESSRRVSYSGTSTTGSYTIGNLGGNTLYQIAVAAVNIAGEGRIV